MAGWTESPDRDRSRPARRPGLPALPWQRRLAHGLAAIRITLFRSHDRRVSRRRAEAR
jgi:hypothetical protein